MESPPARERPRDEDSARSPGLHEPAEIAGSIRHDVQLLFQKHLELARLELLQALEARIKALIAGATAAVAALFMLGFLAATLAEGLDAVMPEWLARLVVAIIFVAAAGVAVLFGRRRMLEPPLASEGTKQALREDAKWAKDRLGP